MRIGFFDSGIGGLTVLHEALRILPGEDYIFYADTLHVPYGEKPKEEVRQYILDAAEFIVGQGVKALVLACNTATSVVVEELRQKYDFPILGIEPAVKPAVRKAEGTHKKVLVLATSLTLNERKYHDLVRKVGHEDLVESLALPGLVRLAEDFVFDEERVAPYLREALAPFDLGQFGTVVLGCTHFQYFEPVIRGLFPEKVDIISGAAGTAKNLKRILEELGEPGAGTGDIRYFRSGVPVTDDALLSGYRELLGMLDR
ncbi:glutamate racemase [Paenibacillus sp. NFR01]|uniref:glutamate racemase n=1 Tax=Paenibacillus sp. NFR01 TaxID=1566279 RepID=UPI0008BCA593|nr:glutamate racemase [Paenibacillus sp. NFR01]SEU26106.1 glutamate racemase [Paenibacillus sp. NFR01]